MEADVDVRDILEEDDSAIVYAEPDQLRCKRRLKTRVSRNLQ